MEFPLNDLEIKMLFRQTEDLNIVMGLHGKALVAGGL